MNRSVRFSCRAALLFALVMPLSVSVFASDNSLMYSSEMIFAQGASVAYPWDEDVLLVSESQAAQYEAALLADYADAADAAEPVIIDMPGEEYFAGSVNAKKVEAELYLKTDDASLGSGTYFGVSGEPVNGFVTGAYAETDERVHDPYGEKRYWNDYPVVTGVETGVYLLYMDYWMPLSRYQTHVDAAREHGFAIELSLQPRTGLDAVHVDDLALMQLARDVEASGVQFYIRFAAEMNDTSGGNPWYTEDTADYIRAFRDVATVFHNYAPSAAMVWSPNYFPSDNITDYYPGDEYVDMVGISLYLPYSVGKEDSLRWIDELETIYALYGDSKPIMITEGAVCFATADGQDLSDFAAEQVRDLFVYLPIRFPNVKFMVWFDAEDVVGNESYSCLTENETVLDVYRETLLESESALSSVDAPAAPVYYGRLEDASVVDYGEVTLCSYIKGGMSAASVSYSVNGEVLGRSSEAPYEITADFSAYRGQTMNLTVSSYDADGALMGEDTFALRVAGGASEPVYTDDEIDEGDKDKDQDKDKDNAAEAAEAAETTPNEEETLLVEEVVVKNGSEDARTIQVELQGKFVTLSADGIAYSRMLQVELDGVSVALPAYAVKNERGYETNYVSLSDVAAVFNGTAAAFSTDLNNAATPGGEHVYRRSPVNLLIDSEPTTMTSIVLEDGSIYFMLRELGQTVGFNVGWSSERGIYFET